MGARLAKGVLTIAIDMESEGVSPTMAEQRRLDEATSALLNQFNRQEMPATWSVVDPANAPVSRRVTSMGAGHEIAIAADASWLAAGRTEFGRELSRRVAMARAGGLSVSTLALRDVALNENHDLALKHGISALRLCPAGTQGAGSRQPLPIRFGLWGFATSVALPGNSRWRLGGGGLRRARREIARAIAECELVQVSIDLPRLAARGFAAQRVVEGLLTYAQRERRNGGLEVLTLAEAARRLASQTQSRPSHSILRPAA